jgi:hypothetical protein
MLDLSKSKHIIHLNLTFIKQIKDPILMFILKDQKLQAIITAWIFIAIFSPSKESMEDLIKLDHIIKANYQAIFHLSFNDYNYNFLFQAMWH